ncbi:MAG: hypothetical protein M1834_008388 [Cirrosporium novae-zelandiae]|nr:MAG: hypothetical protein M1834_008388 [Cirrosporium novae-zelandiae]
MSTVVQGLPNNTTLPVSKSTIHNCSVEDQKANGDVHQILQSVENWLRNKNNHLEKGKLVEKLSAQEAKLKDMNKEIAGLKDTLTIQARTDSSRIAELEEQNKNLKRTRHTLEEEKISDATQIKRLGDEEARLGKELNKKKKELDDLRVQIGILKEKTKGFQSTLDQKEEEANGLRRTVDECRGELRKWESYRSPLEQLKVVDFYNEMGELWKHLSSFCKRCFAQDLPDHILKGQDDWFKWFHSLPLFESELHIPCSNSTAAKNVRMTIAMAVLSALITRDIFTPKRVPRTARDLYDFLVQQAEIDVTKESLCRAILLSESAGGIQEQSSEELISSVVQDADVTLAPLMTSGTHETFLPELRNLIKEAVQLWHKAQISKVRLEASLEVTQTDMTIWRTILLPCDSNHSAPTSPKSTATRPTATPITPPLEDPVELTLFPSIFIASNGGWETVFAGYLIRNSQIAAAEEEWTRTQKAKRIPYSRARRMSFLDNSSHTA